MRTDGRHTFRVCPCGTRLARDNRGPRCRACQIASAGDTDHAPEVPPGFWDHPEIGAALAARHMGRLIAAYRRHPHHGRVLSQERVAAWVGITQPQLSRIEHGAPIQDLGRLTQWARVLGAPAELFWFDLEDGRDRRMAEVTDVPGRTPVATPEAGEIDMQRRDLLRLMGLTTLVTAAGLDPEEPAAGSQHADDPRLLEQHAALNTHLWRVFTLSQSKGSMLPLAQGHLASLVEALRQSGHSCPRQTLCEQVAEIAQLVGETYFDLNRYVEAGQAYALAATAAGQAGAHDLWACALVRSAYVHIRDHRPGDAVPVLDLATRIARRGDPALSTRQWVGAVRAEALAGVGELDACRRALDHAETVTHLDGAFQNGGWLRFDGTRLPEQRGGCYLTLRHLDLAEAALRHAAGLNLSVRRRAGVLVDLAAIGALQCDPDRVREYAEPAITAAQESASGYITGKLADLRPHLAPLRAEPKIRRIDDQIHALTLPAPTH